MRSGILVPFAWANPGTTQQQIDRVQQATEYYDLTLAASNHPKIIGAFPRTRRASPDHGLMSRIFAAASLFCG